MLLQWTEAAAQAIQLGLSEMNELKAARMVVAAAAAAVGKSVAIVVGVTTDLLVYKLVLRSLLVRLGV